MNSSELRNPNINAIPGLIFTKSVDHSYMKLILIELVSEVFDVPISLLKSTRRECAKAALARQVAMYLCHVCFAMNLTNIAKEFGRDHTTVSYACANIEDLRDNRKFDIMLNVIEQAIQAPFYT